jgi:hypothetical protein
MIQGKKALAIKLRVVLAWAMWAGAPPRGADGAVGARRSGHEEAYKEQFL